MMNTLGAHLLASLPMNNFGQKVSGITKHPLHIAPLVKSMTCWHGPLEDLQMS
jgi:hypothetical protein